jgi:carboxypeptidase family protein/TonB-dependent receptor-like protein
MVRTLGAFLIVGSVLTSVPAAAQSGQGSLNGYVKDEQGGILPGVTVTASGPEIQVPVTAVTDSAGYYRLQNLPPGTLTLTAELTGFSTFRREGILMRAGSTFTIDVELKVGALEETVMVTGESPMVSTGVPTKTLTVEGDLLRAAPISSRRAFSDVLDMAPGVNSRNSDGASGQRMYYFHGTTLFSTVVMLEGQPAGTYNDASAFQIDMGTETVADAEVKLGGVDASSPTGTSVVMNIIAPRGGNALKGSVQYEGAKFGWNSDNTQNSVAPGGTPTSQSINQWDASVGGPIRKDKIWAFGAYRYSDLGIGVSRLPLDLSFLTTFRPDFQPFNNYRRGNQQFAKVTTHASLEHEVTAFYQYQHALSSSGRERDLDQICCSSSGGGVYSGQLQSVWTNRLTTSISGSYNNKGGNTLSESRGAGPQMAIHQSAPISRGVPTGTGVLVMGNNVQSISLSPASMVVLRGDLTYFKEGWRGSHEFKTGIWAAPRLARDVTTIYSNDGFVLDEFRQVDPNSPAAGLVSFHRQYRSPAVAQTISTRDRDVAFYVQDSWKPTPRVTASMGVRVNYVKRHDQIFDVVRENAREIGPRLGVSYMVTSDARNVLRASYGRLYEQTNGRDYITTFAQGVPVGSTLTDKYSTRGDGVYDITIVTPQNTPDISAQEFNQNLHNPYVDEIVVGFAKQFPGRVALDIAATHRNLKDGYTLVDINGIYPSGPNQPFKGFGLVDPNRGQILQENNRTWAYVEMTNLEATLAKNLSHNLQGTLSVTRQWHAIRGTWGQTDPARFIQPDAFENIHDLSQYLFGNGDTNSLSGGGRESGVAYRPYSVRMAGQYFAPYGFRLGVSYVVQAGGWVGPIITQIARADPVFGPSLVTLANGTTQSNPLATTIRFCGAAALPCATSPIRSDGQTRNEDEKYMQLHVSREFRPGPYRAEVGLSVFNLFNNGAMTQWNIGANQLYSPNYLSRFNRTSSRQLQFSFKFRF